MWGRVRDMSEADPFRESNLPDNNFGLGARVAVQLGWILRLSPTWSRGNS